MDHGKVIALGSPRELIHSIGGDHVIEFTLENGNGVAEPSRGLDGFAGRRGGLDR
ncbi:MAG: hypothetical protein U1D30_16950 [Planctomycetota bacterium]